MRFAHSTWSTKGLPPQMANGWSCTPNPARTLPIMGAAAPTLRATGSIALPSKHASRLSRSMKETTLIAIALIGVCTAPAHCLPGPPTAANVTGLEQEGKELFPLRDVAKELLFIDVLGVERMVEAGHGLGCSPRVYGFAHNSSLCRTGQDNKRSTGKASSKQHKAIIWAINCNLQFALHIPAGQEQHEQVLCQVCLQDQLHGSTSEVCPPHAMLLRLIRS